MRFNLAHITLAITSVWVLLNLAAIAFFTTLFYIEQAWFVVRRRRHLRTTRLAPVISITFR